MGIVLNGSPGRIWNLTVEHTVWSARSTSGNRPPGCPRIRITQANFLGWAGWPRTPKESHQSSESSGRASTGAGVVRAPATRRCEGISLL